MMYVIYEHGGKQYKVVEGGVLTLDKMNVPVNKIIDLEKTGKVLFADGVEPKKLAKVRIKAKVVEHLQAPKVVAFKYKAKKNYRRKIGHRQAMTRLLVQKISTGVKPTTGKKKAETDSRSKSKAAETA